MTSAAAALVEFAAPGSTLSALCALDSHEPPLVAWFCGRSGPPPSSSFEWVGVETTPPLL